MSAYLNIIALAVAFGVGAFVGADYKDSQWVIKQNEINTAHRDELDKQNALSEAASRKMREQVEQIDKLQEQLTNDRQETDALRNDLAAGSKRLFIQTKRASSCEMSRAADAASMGDGESSQLSDKAGRAYTDLRASIKLKERQLEGCQAYISTLKGGWK